MDNRELIWVDKDFAREYKELESDTVRAEMVKKLIKDKGRDITDHIQNLDDDLLRFKAFALDYSVEFKKAYDTQAVKLEQIWEASNEPIDKIDRTTLRMKDAIEGISKTVKDLDQKLKTLDTYKLERVLDLIKTYSNMSEKDKEVFKIIMDSRE